MMELRDQMGRSHRRAMRWNSYAITTIGMSIGWAVASFAIWVLPPFDVGLVLLACAVVGIVISVAMQGRSERLHRRWKRLADKHLTRAHMEIEAQMAESRDEAIDESGLVPVETEGIH